MTPDGILAFVGTLIVGLMGLLGVYASQKGDKKKANEAAQKLLKELYDRLQLAYAGRIGDLEHARDAAEEALAASNKANAALARENRELRRKLPHG